MNDITDQDLDDIRAFLMFVATEHKDAFTWPVTPRQIRKICRLIKNKNYHTIRILYGNYFLETIMLFNEEHENYEECSLIHPILTSI